MPVLERPPGPPKLASLELFSFPRGFKSSSVDCKRAYTLQVNYNAKTSQKEVILLFNANTWRRGEGDLWNTGDLTSMPALMGEVLEALMLLWRSIGSLKKHVIHYFTWLKVQMVEE